MTTDAKQSWAGERMPCLGGLCGALFAPRCTPEGKYLDTLPGLIAIALAFLTLSGAVMAAYYDPWHAFASVQFIRREVNNGWLVQAYHATGATALFGLVYLHLFRVMLTRAYRAPGEFAWWLAVKLLALLLFVGWMGFVLSGGAAGYWSLFNAANAAVSLPGAPGAVARWFLGGPAAPASLARLEMFHTVLALAALAVAGGLLAARRKVAPQPAPGKGVAFYPYYLAQYLAALAVFALIFSVLLFFAPHFGQPAVNALAADPLTLPAGTALPWYLLPLAGVADALPGLWGGVAGVAGALVVLAALPWLDRAGPDGAKGKLYCALTWILALDVLALGATSAAHDNPQAPLLLGLFTLWYFFHFLVLTPLVTAMEAK
ncbi:cytochrome b N-terminal domain-containing protein [Acidocella sp. KAb 2-4]|uniref:cytochrome b N-terminal domain-containing protein n=1 Tax=Acidocella sp. KAb 2-4 TaxID=2885158 RepID=UPI001D077DD1|nr:cytochrome b N-terminal domain-containing protein [Acidocella sp. KAb 2-4]MCB5945208.1 cytochrome b N-terminal domain-containing protein [Acidocella sp. KAb 2-4]